MDLDIIIDNLPNKQGGEQSYAGAYWRVSFSDPASRNLPVPARLRSVIEDKGFSLERYIADKTETLKPTMISGKAGLLQTFEVRSLGFR